MIQRSVIGKPFPTESVVLDLPAETGPEIGRASCRERV